MTSLPEPEVDGLVCMWTALGRQCAVSREIKKEVNNL